MAPKKKKKEVWKKRKWNKRHQIPIRFWSRSQEVANHLGWSWSWSKKWKKIQKKKKMRNEKKKKNEKRKKQWLVSGLKLLVIKDAYNGDLSERWRWKGRGIFFFHFFNFLGNPPKIFKSNAAVTLTSHPWTSNHCAPHTMPYTAVVVLSWLDEFDRND